MRTSDVTKLSISLGAILLAFACSLLLLTSTLFFTGITISRFHVLVTAMMAAGFGWWAVSYYFQHDRVRMFGMVFGSTVISSSLFALRRQMRAMTRASIWLANPNRSAASLHPRFRHELPFGFP
jgi:hypothetical protein